MLAWRLPQAQEVERHAAPPPPSPRAAGRTAAAAIVAVLLALAAARWRYGWAPAAGHNASHEAFEVDDYARGRGSGPTLTILPGSPLHARLTRWLDGLRGFRPSLVTYVPSLSIRCPHLHANLGSGNVVINYGRQPNAAWTQMERPATAEDQALRRDLSLLVGLFGERKRG